MPTQFVTRQIKDAEVTDDQLAPSALFLTTVEVDHTLTPYAVQSVDQVILVDTTTSEVVISLPAWSSTPNGRRLVIKDAGGAAGTRSIRVGLAGLDTLDGGPSVRLSSNRSSLTILRTPREWIRLDSIGRIEVPVDGRVLPDLSWALPLTVLEEGASLPGTSPPIEQGLSGNQTREISLGDPLGENAPLVTDEVPGQAHPLTLTVTGFMSLGEGPPFDAGTPPPSLRAHPLSVTGLGVSPLLGTEVPSGQFISLSQFHTDLDSISPPLGGTSSLPVLVSAHNQSISFEPSTPRDGGSDDMPTNS